MQANDLLEERIHFRHLGTIVHFASPGTQLVRDLFAELVLEFGIVCQTEETETQKRLAGTRACSENVEDDVFEIAVVQVLRGASIFGDEFFSGIQQEVGEVAILT